MWNIKYLKSVDKCPKFLIESKFLKVRLCINLLLISENFQYRNTKKKIQKIV